MFLAVSCNEVRNASPAPHYDWHEACAGRRGAIANARELPAQSEGSPPLQRSVRVWRHGEHVFATSEQPNTPGYEEEEICVPAVVVAALPNAEATTARL